MRILHLNTDGWYEREGIARTIAAIAARLDHDHHIVAQQPSGSVFAGLHRVAAHPSRLPWSFEVHRVLERVQPDVVHLHGGAWAPLLADAPALRDLPVVASLYRNVTMPRAHGHPVDLVRDLRGGRVRMARSVAVSFSGVRLSRRALRAGWVRAICTPDAVLAAALHGAGPVVLAPGAASVSSHRARWSEAPTIVFAGRAETGRGIDDLIEAFIRVRTVIPAARLRLLLLAGSAADRYRQLSVPGVDVRFDAFSELDAELADCQVAAMPFRLDMTMTPPLVAAEAMSVGLPVVATDLPCLSALVDETNGALVPPRRPAALAAALLDVLSSEERWSHLSRGAIRTIAEDWNWDRAAEGAQRAYGIALGPQRRFRFTAPVGEPAAAGTTARPSSRPSSRPTASDAAARTSTPQELALP